MDKQISTKELKVPKLDEDEIGKKKVKLSKLNLSKADRKQYLKE